MNIEEKFIQALYSIKDDIKWTSSTLFTFDKLCLSAEYCEDFKLFTENMGYGYTRNLNNVFRKAMVGLDTSNKGRKQSWPNYIITEFYIENELCLDTKDKKLRYNILGEALDLYMDFTKKSVSWFTKKNILRWFTQTDNTWNTTKDLADFLHTKNYVLNNNFSACYIGPTKDDKVRWIKHLINLLGFQMCAGLKIMLPLSDFPMDNYNSNSKRLYCKAFIAREHAEHRQGDWTRLGNNYQSEIDSMYLDRKTGEHMDHIIARISKDDTGNHIACGLHVPWNLQIMDATDNLVKGSKIDTDQTIFTQMVWLQTRLINGGNMDE